MDIICMLREAHIEYGVSIDGFLALVAGLLAYVGALQAARRQVNAVHAQIEEAQEENRENRGTNRRAQAQEKLAAATLVGSALAVLKFDIYHIRNIFDPGEDNP